MRRNVTIVFADLAGSTVLGESLDAEALRYVTGRYFEAMRAAVERHEGTVEKFIGDAVVAVFGVPRVREDDALRAVRAAADMRASLGGLSDELEGELAVTLQLRIGVNTGEVIVGERRAGGSFATGDAVNVAARLEQAAEPGEILLGESTHRLVGPLATVEPVDPLALKGKAELVPAWRLLGVSQSPAIVRAPSDAAFVGRDSQLRLLEDAYRRIDGERVCQLVTVLGVAGMGKSRLAEVFVATLDDATVLSGGCLSYGHGATYWPLREALLDAVGLTGEEDVDTAESAFTQALSGAPDTAGVVPRLVAVTGYRPTETMPDGIPWAVRTFLEYLARLRPVVLVIDDLHWAESGLLDVLEHVVDWSRDAPIMVLGLARPEFYENRPTWGGGKLNATALLLSALDAAAAGSLIDKHDLPPIVLERIVGAAGGNPLFVEQLVAMLVDDGHLALHDGQASWIGGNPDELTWSMPPTVSALLTARIDRLSEEERTVLGCASVIGTVFYVDAIATVADIDAQRVDELLGQMVRKELLRTAASDLAGFSAYRFLHVLVRDSAYEGLAKSARAEWHELTAAWLGRLGSELVPDEIVGHHLASAWECRRQLGPATEHTRALAKHASEKLASAGRRLELSDLAAGAALLQRCVDMLEPHDPQRAGCLLTLSAQRLQLGEIDASRDALRLAATAADPRQEVLREVLACSSSIMTGGDRIEDRVAVLDRAIERFRGWNDDAGLAHAYLVQADLAGVSWQPSRAAELLALSLRHAESVGDLGCIARARSQLAVMYLFGPTPAETVIASLAQMLASSGDDPRVRGEAEQVTCVMHAMCGRVEQARADAVDARRHLAQAGHKLFLANLAQSTGHLEELAGDDEAADAEYERSAAALTALGESSYLSTVSGLHARLLARRGKTQRAEHALDIAERHGSPDDVSTQTLILQTQGLLAAARGDAGLARAATTRAVHLTNSGELPDDSGEAHLAAADVERLLGDQTAEREHLAKAQSLFQTKGNVVRASQAAARLTDGDRQASQAPLAP